MIRQKLTLRPPCRECPFLKKSIKGWLGHDTPQQVFAKVHGDGPFGYPCHMDSDVVSRNNRDHCDFDDGEWRNDPGSVEQCTGALLHAAKTAKAYADPWREAARGALKLLVKLDGILGFDFLAHHGGKA